METVMLGQYRTVRDSEPAGDCLADCTRAFQCGATKNLAGTPFFISFLALPGSVIENGGPARLTRGGGPPKVGLEESHASPYHGSIGRIVGGAPRPARGCVAFLLPELS